MSLRLLILRVMGSLTLLSHCVLTNIPVEAAAVARVTPDGSAIEIETGTAQGSPLMESIPIHRAGRVRYFSAGVGLAEREATYPSFPLKIMFVAGQKAYLSRVAVTISDRHGTALVQIPAEHVTGPWLFVDLPAGTYTIGGRIENQANAHTSVNVAADAKRSSSYDGNQVSPNRRHGSLSELLFLLILLPMPKHNGQSRQRAQQHERIRKNKDTVIDQPTIR